AVLELDEHAHTATEFHGGWDAFLELRATARRHAEEAYATYVDQRDTLKQRAQTQREWAQQGRSKVKKSDERDKFIRHFKTVQTEKLAAKARASEKALER